VPSGRVMDASKRATSPPRTISSVSSARSAFNSSTEGHAAHLGEPLGELLALRALGGDERATHHPYGIAGDLPHHPEQLAEVAELQSQVLVHLLETCLVGVEARPSARSLRRSSAASSSWSCCKQRPLLVPVLHETLLARLAVGAHLAAGFAHLLQQLVQRVDGAGAGATDDASAMRPRSPRNTRVDHPSARRASRCDHGADSVSGADSGRRSRFGRRLLARDPQSLDDIVAIICRRSPIRPCSCSRTR
jgi:hypothetical protein